MYQYAVEHAQDKFYTSLRVLKMSLDIQQSR